MSKYTTLTLKALRQDGLKAGMVERWIPGANVRKDLFGVIDIIALDFKNQKTLGVQSTGSDYSGHMKKILESSDAMLWLTVPCNELQLWAWRPIKIKRGGKAFRYEPRIYNFTIGDFI